MTLENRFRNGEAAVGVVGLGYVGLPLAVAFAEAGFCVIGLDLDEDKVGKLDAGVSYLIDVAAERLAPLVKEGRIAATSDFSRLRGADAVVICVPTPLDERGRPDLGAVMAVVARLRELPLRGKLVVLESTTWPGTTEEIVRPALEEFHGEAGRDFHLAFSPERIDPGNRRYNVVNTPKVVGGVTPACTAAAAALYSRAVETVVTVGSAGAAEMVKLLENTFRAVNIGLANETAVICDRLGIDVWEVIDAAATKPFGFTPFYPGPGLGGHCIPVDPRYLEEKLSRLHYRTRFIGLAREINSAMPEYVVGKVGEALSGRGKELSGSRLLILGVAYKREVDDLRESPALRIMALLRQSGAEVRYHDELVPALSIEMPGEKGDWELHSRPLTAEELERCDCAVLVTDHSHISRDHVVRHAPLVFDTRNYFAGIDNPKIHRL